MAWMIKSGKSAEANGRDASALSIVSTPGAGECGWRLFSTTRTSLTGHPTHESAAVEQVWQDVLANLIPY